jgi:phytoene dehydrogenase-like protein
VFAHLGITPELVKQDPGILVRMPDGDLPRWADPERWIEEASQRFGGDQRGFWTEQYELERRVWDVVGSTPMLPPSTLADLAALARPRHLRSLPLLPGLLRPVSTRLRRWGVDDPRFRAFLDEQLLISTQNTAERAPYLPGAMGLTYPSETYYPMGGMVQPALLLMRNAQAHGARFLFRRRVSSIAQIGQQWEVVTDNGEVHRAPIVVSSIPIWNMTSLTHGNVSTYMQGHARRFGTSWAAITMYLALNGTPALPSTYVQLFLDEPIPYVHSSSLFLTVSPPDDVAKAPAGHCTVTISTHARSEDWEGITPDEAMRRKNLVMDAILRLLERRMPEFNGMEHMHVEGGTPFTWERYTGRHRGFVGGIPHDISSPLLLLPPNRTPFDGLYMIGDSVFPGQGTPAVMLGAWNTVSRIFAS